MVRGARVAVSLVGAQRHTRSLVDLSAKPHFAAGLLVAIAPSMRVVSQLGFPLASLAIGITSASAASATPATVAKAPVSASVSASSVGASPERPATASPPSESQ